MLLRIPRDEHLDRIRRITEELGRRNLDALYLTNPASIFYVTGYPFHPGSRPFGLLILRDGDLTMIIPQLEATHIRERKPVGVSSVVSYWEYPGKPDPLEVVRDTFKRKRLESKRIGFDGSVIPDIPGYGSVPLSSLNLAGCNLVPSKDIVDSMRLIKSKQEIQLYREAAKWANLAHTLLHKSIKPGLSEIQVSAKATYEATVAMLKALGPDYEPLGLVWYPAWARFKAGPRTAYSHGLLVNRRVRVGDPVETAAAGMVGGYENHLERTMFVGHPNEKFTRYFSIMLRMHDAAISACRPGAICEEVHQNTLRVVKEAGLDPAVVVHHRTGHGMGLEQFEPPFLVDGDTTSLAPGMVFTVEPAIYIDGYACFRHCDTVAVTDEGCEVIDYYPRSLDDLIIANR